MRLSFLVLSAVFTLAMTEVGFAQATLPDDAVNSANNPGSVKNDAPVRQQALDCTCHFTAPGATAPIGDTGPGDQILRCGCHESAPDTTGTLAAPSDAPVPGATGTRPSPSR